LPGEYLPPVVTQLVGDLDDLVRKVAEAKALIQSIGNTSVKVGFDIDQASLARAQSAAKAAFSSGVTVPVRFDVNAGGALARGAGWGVLGWALGLGRRGVNLFGGVLPGILGTVGGLHLLIDGIAEVFAVALPATIALAAFGVAASDAVKNIFNQFSAIHTVMDATGQAIPPMTNAMEKLHQSVQPQVYSILGDALTVVNNKAGEFTTIAQGASDVMSQLAARMTVALTGSGISGFMKNAVADLQGFANVFANIGGIFGAVLKNVPGYAQVFLNILQGLTHGLETFANSGVGQGIIRIGLAFHGAFLYLGLLGTAIARIAPLILGWIVRLADAAALGALRLGFAGLADGLAGVAGGAELAAAGPWGWIGLVAVGAGLLAYKFANLKDATQQWTQTMQTALASKTAGAAGFSALVQFQAQTVGKLAQAQMGLANSQHDINMSQLTAARVYTGNASAAQVYSNRVNDLTSRQVQLSDETNLYNYRLDALAAKYGGTTMASELLTRAGVKMSAMLDKSGQAWKIIQQQVSGVVQGYAAMGQRSGVLGADLYVITHQATDQFKAMQQLNQAWSTFIGLSTGLQTSFYQVVQSMRQVTSEAQKAHTSFTGVTASSITMQQNFESTFIPQLQNVKNAMLQGGASSADMAKVISTVLSPAVHEGALQNQAMRQQIYDMARQAGFTGPNAIRPLTSFIDHNRTSTQAAASMVDRFGAALIHLPKSEHLSVLLHGSGSWSLSGGEGPGGTGIGSHIFQRRARGGRIPGFGGGDHVPVLAEPGEAFIDKYRTRKYASTLAAMGVPGFASGGIVPGYSGNVGGMGPWATNNYRASVNDFASAMAKSFASSMSAMMGGSGRPGGMTSAGGQYNIGSLENLWQQAGGPGGYIARIAAAIALAESGGNPLARNPSGASGLWQILGQVVGGNIFSPFVNALNAVSKFDSAHGFSPWVTYTTGAYLRYMDQGGYLQPGLNMIMNGTGQRERVLSPDEGMVIENHLYIDGKEVSVSVQRQARRYNRRNGVRGTNKWGSPA
jgi:Lysozyme like domain